MDEARIEAIESELAIRNLVARYTEAVIRADADAWTATWAKDSVWHLFGTPIEGRDAIVSAWKGAMGMFDTVHQYVHSGVVEVDGAAARGRWILTEVGVLAGKGDRVVTVGAYHDDYVRSEAGWVFARRQFDVLQQGPPDLSGDYKPFPEL